MGVNLASWEAGPGPKNQSLQPHRQVNPWFKTKGEGIAVGQ